MTQQSTDPWAEPATVQEILLLVLEADKYPRLGNEDWVVAVRMEAAALMQARTAVSSPSDPLEFAGWLETLRKPNLRLEEREHVMDALRDYFEPRGAPSDGQRRNQL